MTLMDIPCNILILHLKYCIGLHACSLKTDNVLFTMLASRLFQNYIQRYEKVNLSQDKR